MPRQMKTIEKKSGRRGNNEGSIYQRKDGRWCAQVMVGYRENGKAIFKYAYGNSRQEVAKKLSQFTHEVFENGYSSFAPGDINLFYPLLEDWYFTFKEPNIGSGTSEKLRNFMKNHIMPELGELTVSQVLTTLSIYSHVISKSVYESTAKTLDRVFDNLNVKGKTGEPCIGSPVLTPLKIDSSFDSNAVNFRQF